MKRLHVHLTVADLDRTVRFYRTLFGTAPDKLKDDYAQWMLDDPAVNFAVSTGECCGEDRNGVSHLGIQVDDDESLAAITGALTDAEHSIFEERERTCCYARGNKTWAADPDGVVWETSTGSAIPIRSAAKTISTPRSTPCTAGPRRRRPQDLSQKGNRGVEPSACRRRRRTHRRRRIDRQRAGGRPQP